MDDPLRVLIITEIAEAVNAVLILIVMDDPLRDLKKMERILTLPSCLNPYCNGWSSKSKKGNIFHYDGRVLILIVMDDPLRATKVPHWHRLKSTVLILIVMDDPLRVVTKVSTISIELKS